MADDELMALVREIRDLLKASQVHPRLTDDETRRLVEQVVTDADRQARAVNEATPPDNLWGTR